MSNTWWGKNDIALLKRLYPIASKEELLLAFSDRTVKAIQRRAHRLGLKRININHSHPLGNPDVYPDDVDSDDIRDIPDAPGYAVTRDGRVWSKKTDKWLKPGLGTQGYLLVLPCVNGKNVCMYIHVLICRLFHGSKPQWAECVRHLNDIKDDNRAQNLAWGTRSDNQQDRIRNGTYQYGEKNPASFLTEDIVRRIRTDYKKGVRQSELMKNYSLQRSNIWSIVHRKTWRHLDD